MANLLGDEDFEYPVVEELRQFGYDVVTVQEAGLAGRDDADVLTFAVSQGRAVVTYNRKDYKRLHRRGRPHRGIIVCTRDRNYLAFAQRIDQAIRAKAPLDDQLISIVRPNVPRSALLRKRHVLTRFLETLYSGRARLMDGAMGTELLRAGLTDEECGEQWNLTHAEEVLAVHRAYAAAGAEVLLTNTFQSNPWALERRGLGGSLKEINRRALALARAAAAPGGFVLADIGPIVSPQGPGEFGDPDAVAQVFPELATADGLLLETCSDPRALLAARHCKDLLHPRTVPVLLSLTYQRGPGGQLTTRSGHPPEAYAEQARRHGIAALGVNCGREIGMEEVMEIVRRYRRATDLPLFARPNAGTLQRVGGSWVYPHTPKHLAARLPELLEAGVCMVGGCCGTTPEHVAAFRPVIDEWNRAKGKGSGRRPPSPPAAEERLTP